MQGKAATACSFRSVAGAESDQDLLLCAVCGPRYSILRFQFFFFRFFLMLVLNQISNSDLKPNFGYKSRFRMSAS